MCDLLGNRNIYISSRQRRDSPVLHQQQHMAGFIAPQEQSPSRSRTSSFAMANKPVALVTGCSAGGIGHALALELAGRGLYHVVATSRSLSTLDEALLAHPAIETMALDVSSMESISQAVDAILTQAGPISILINNAGTSCYAPTAELPFPLLENVFRTNVYGPLALIQAVLPQMIEAGSGKIVNVGSVVGLVANPWSGGYCASKAALHALTDTLRIELKPFGVQVILVIPGAISTRFAEKAYEVVKGLKLNIYKLQGEAIAFRLLHYRQQKATPTDVFAKKTVDAILQKNPPKHFLYGHLSSKFAFLYHMPCWVRDWWLSKTFSLSGHNPDLDRKKQA